MDFLDDHLPSDGDLEQLGDAQEFEDLNFFEDEELVSEKKIKIKNSSNELKIDDEDEYEVVGKNIYHPISSTQEPPLQKKKKKLVKTVKDSPEMDYDIE